MRGKNGSLKQDVSYARSKLMTRQSEYTKMRQNRYAKRLLKKRGVGLTSREKDYKIALDAKETEVDEARVEVAQAEKETDISKKMTDRILEMARERLERVEGGLKKKDRVNFYHASTWSFLHTVLQLCLQQQQQEVGEMNNDGRAIWKVLSNIREKELRMEAHTTDKTKESLAERKERLIRTLVTMVIDLEQVSKSRRMRERSSVPWG
jgi:hypothetical protein